MKYKNLREFKENKGLTSAELAETLGLSAIYIALLLTNKRRPSPETARKISNKTGVPVLNLLFPNQ